MDFVEVDYVNRRLEDDESAHVFFFFFPSIIVKNKLVNADGYIVDHEGRPIPPAPHRRPGFSDDDSLDGFALAIEKAVKFVGLFAEKPWYVGDVNVKIVTNITPTGGLTQEKIDESKTFPLSFNNLAVLREPLDFYMSFFNNQAIKDNLEYIASAYHKRYLKEKMTSNKASLDGFRAFIKRYTSEIDETAIRNTYAKVDDFAYTVITLHTIVAAMGRYQKNVVDQYLRGLMAFHMRRAFYGCHEAMAEAFALYVRDEVFYMEGKLFRFRGTKCEEGGSNVLATERKVEFFAIADLNLRALLSRKASEQLLVEKEKWEKNKTESLKSFSLKTVGAYVEKIIESYLTVKRYSGVDRYGTAYKDGLVIVSDDPISGKKKLTIRRMFMEDQIFETGNAHLFPPEKYSRDHPMIRSIDECFKHVFVHDDQVDWFYRWMGSLHAKDPERIFLILHGAGGGNAKSVLMKALGKVLGRYCYAATDNLLHMDPTSGHQASLAEAEGRNLIYISEPTTLKKVPCNAAKDICGGDDKTASKKGKEHRTFAQTAKFVELCNQIPSFDSPDEALYSRMRIIECIGRYVHAKLEDEAKLPEHTKRADDTFWTRPGIEDALLWIMLDRWNEYVEQRLVANRHHELALDVLKNRICSVKKFLVENCKDDPEKWTLSMYDVDQVWDIYESWFQHKKPNVTKLEQADFIKTLRNIAKVETKDVIYKDSNDGTKGKETRKDVVMLWIKNPLTCLSHPSRCTPIEEPTARQDPNLPQPHAMA